MSDLSNPAKPGPVLLRLWLEIKKAFSRLRDWFVIQSLVVRLTVLVVAVLIPASGIYSFRLIQKQAVLAAQVKTMAVAGNAGEGVWVFNAQLPVVLGTGSVLSFLETNPVERITVIYEPLTWNVSDRIVLVESKGMQHAFRYVPGQGLIDHDDALDRVRFQKAQHRAGAQHHGQLGVECPHLLARIARHGHGLDLRGQDGLLLDQPE